MGFRDFILAVKLKGIDGVSNTLSKAGQSVAKFQNKMMAVNAAIMKYNKARQHSHKEGEESQSGHKEGGFGKVAEFATLVGLAEFAHKATEAYNEMEAAMANVKNGLESTKNAAGLSLEELKEKSESLMKSSIFQGDEILQNVTAQMITFTNVTGEEFSRAQQATLDITSKLHGLNATGEDLQGMAVKLGRALNDPLKGMGGLSRMGVTFNKGQERMIRYFTLTGQVAKAQGIILNEVEKKFGGSAQTIAETAGGAEKQIANKLHDSLERLGKNIQPIEVKLLKFAGVLIDKLADIMDWAERNRGVVENLGGAILAFAGTIFTLNKAIEVWAALQKAMAFTELIQKAMLATNGLKGLAVVQAFLNALWTANPVGLIVVGVAALAAIGFVLFRNWSKIKPVIEGIWKAFKGLVKNIVNSPIVQALLLPFKPLIDLIQFLWKLGGKSALQGVSNVSNMLKGGSSNSQSSLSPLQYGPSIFSPFSGSGLIQQRTEKHTERQEISIKFDNMPKGTRVDSSRVFSGVDLSMGWANGN